jgi:cobalt-zinc-cadmium efflux system protein
MSSGHGHHHRTAGNQSRLRIALAITFLYMIAEWVGGWYTNSLALIADAGHMLTDVAAMVLTLAAYWLASRPATSKKTYGYYRTEILAAFINGIALVILSLGVIYSAILRWNFPPDVPGLELSLIAGGGLIVNVAAAYLLHAGQRSDINMRAAWLHVMGDLLGSVIAIAAGIMIAEFGYLRADAAGSIIISVIIVAGAWRLILESVNILLEGTPAHISRSSVEGEILAMPGVAGVHDLHIWTISSGLEALSAHITHDNSIIHSELLAAIRGRLHDKFGIDHLTIQIESLNQETEAIYVCETGTKCFEPTAVPSGRSMTAGRNRGR